MPHITVAELARICACYDTQSMENELKPQCLLAALLGYKTVKWIERIDFIESEKQVGKGEGGKNENDEYFDLLPNI